MICTISRVADFNVVFVDNVVVSLVGVTFFYIEVVVDAIEVILCYCVR